MQTNFTDRPRCFQPDLRSNTPCPEEFVVNPDNEATFLKNEGLTMGAKGSAGGSGMAGGSGAAGGSAGSFGASGSVVQVQPQHVGLKLRVGES
jgi:hypothetical protein